MTQQYMQAPALLHQAQLLVLHKGLLVVAPIHSLSIFRHKWKQSAGEADSPKACVYSHALLQLQAGKLAQQHIVHWT